MTKKLEEFFDLHPVDPDDNDGEESKEMQLADESKELATSEDSRMHDRINNALAEVKGLGDHDLEMDDVAEKALDTYEKLVQLGLNTSDAHAGKILEVAATMLKTALDAKDAKATKKLKMIDMQIKKAKVDIESGNYDGSSTAGVEFDRNDLMKMIKDQKQDDPDK